MSENFRAGYIYKCQKNDMEKYKNDIFLKMSDLSDLLNRTRWFRFFWEFPKFWIFLILLYWHRCNFLKFLGSSFFKNIRKIFWHFWSQVRGMGSSFSDGPRPKLISGQVKTDLSSRSSARKYWWGIGGKMAISWVKHAINNEL